MITNWKVSNFKSIRDETELHLAPLTLFAGANSSGKSTFIQSILLVAQTLANKVSSRSVVLNGALTSLGQFDDLRSSGSAAEQILIKCTCRPRWHEDSTRSQKLQSPSSRKRLYYAPRESTLREVSCTIQFDADSSNPSKEVFQTQPRLLATDLECRAHDDDGRSQMLKIAVHYSSNPSTKTEDLSNPDHPLAVALAYDVDLDEESIREIREDFISAKPVGCMLRHFLPDRIVYRIDPVHEEARAITESLGDWRSRRMLSRRNLWRRPSHGSRERNGQSRDVLLTKEILDVVREVLEKENIKLDEIVAGVRTPLYEQEDDAIPFELWQRSLRMLSPNARVKVQQTLQEFPGLSERILSALRESARPAELSELIVLGRPRQVLEAVGYLDDFFALSVKYLGPLRDAPRPLYPVAPAADPHDVGLRGERTASVLELYKNQKVRYIPSERFQTSEIESRAALRKLETAVGDWLRYLDVASSVESKDRGKLGHELRVGLKGTDGKQDLTHVGVGVSQVLPILVMSLLADEDSVLIFEQPELHLHPKVQTLLGDFFLSMALCNKQCIVETHSEYLIDRLRYRIAADSGGSTANLTRTYFVEKSEGRSVFREVKVNEYGAIPEWPEGFFDQSQRQAEDILVAAAKKRIRRRSGGRR